jgi:predicted ester cyclase
MAGGDENKAVVARLTRELFNDGGDPAAADELLTDDFVDHMPAAGTAGDRESFKQRALQMRGPFSDIRTRSDEIVAEGDVVAERWTCTFRHTGDFMGLPGTGAEVEIAGFAMYRMREGRVAEFWGLSDAMGLMQQLGALPEPPA